MIRDAIGNVLRARAAEHPDRVCCALDDTTYTFAEMDAVSDRIAGGLAALGIGKGDRVATLSPNRRELLELFYGVAKSGAAQVPLNAFLKGEFLRYQLSHSGASVLVTDAAGRDAVAPMRDQLPELKTIVMLDEAAGDELAYASLREAEPVAAVEVGPDDIMSIVYTSGTTGLPKGCLASHGYYCRSGEMLGRGMEIGDGDILFAGLPLFHAGGRLATVTMPLMYGIPAYIQGAFSASEYMKRSAEVGATVIIAVGAMGAAVLASPPSPYDRAHKVRRMMCAPMSPAAQEPFRERFGIDTWVDVFGQSECMPVTVTPLSSDQRDPAGCGVGAPDLEVVLLGDDLVPVADGEVGEICMRPLMPYTMFDGYYQRPESTLEAFKGLWYHTGDYGRKLPSGAFTFVDRKKDALRRRGENISSMELEGAILGHPAVADCAVHGVPSELGEDDIKAWIVVAQGTKLAADDLFGYFRDHLPYFAIPRFVEAVDTLPRNAVGRVMKHQLRERGNGADVLDFAALGLTITKDERR